MSDGYDYFSAAPPSPVFGGPPATLSVGPVPGPGPALPSRPGRSPRVLGAAGAAVVLLLALAGWWFRPVDHHGAVVLPERVLGVSQAQGGTDFGTQASWLSVAAKDLPGVTVKGRGYSAGRGARPLMINVVVARTDLTGKLDRHLAVEPYSRYGSVTCSHTFDLSTPTSHSAPSTTDTMALCWRTSRMLSVSILVLGQGPVTDDQIADAVQQVWDVQPPA